MKDLSYKLFFTAISNQTRSRIVELLRKGPKNVTQICKNLGFEQSRVSHNLKCLEMCGFVNGKYNSKNKVYSLAPEIVSILDAVDKHFVKYYNHLKTCGVLEKRKAR